MNAGHLRPPLVQPLLTAACVLAALWLLGGCGNRAAAPRKAWQTTPPVSPAADPTTTPGTGPTGPATPTGTAPAGVSYRDDCSHIPVLIEPQCQPRTPTPLPPGGAQEVISDPPQAAQLLCSAVPDAAVQQILGAFYAYSNPRGECHLDKAKPAGTEHSVHLTSAISPIPVKTFRTGDGPAWHSFRLGARYAGYIDVWDDVRWYRVGLGPDPDAPGTLLVFCRLIAFAGPHTTRTLPAPAGFWSVTDGYVRQLTAHLTR